ncbi:TlpA disulfide reductase family protein [Shimia thalassica]|nr:TlpA disulfide reductase family protein [Shimia thalassica]MDO6478527.1 TlpA disulfide reductase family protein [Shimia thalassica]MDO6484738.1 TlpA disulfide reductase family protein [Shimia thalassica]MDO6501730.1 TlpA disulfide reductase family protein [Shimia thalassica]MDO6797931.1 TlpA disulfide reductase family protein [Shimia thalassica]MDP2493249.1 TlpA disulfide reductase family protein [Shimia thalassica]
MSAVAAMREGDMKKLNFHPELRKVSEKTFDAENGTKMTLADYEGQYVLLNFWATWCAPCRKEMPMLSDLQAEFGGDDFQVVTLATGRNAPPAMKKFFDEIGVDNLPLHRDPQSAVARDMAVLGLPVTALIDKNGNEIARLTGDADWSSDNAKAILRNVIGATQDQ